VKYLIIIGALGAAVYFGGTQFGLIEGKTVSEVVGGVTSSVDQADEAVRKHEESANERMRAAEQALGN